ncbi:MAG TPA: T9SS type A sorting domain-containing protein [Chitinophagales bacterium]|nr:T9SS type A sorting domain-containing protein [Chitinophagales bacterium]
MKNIVPTFLFVTALMTAYTLHGQVAPSIEWAKCFGGSIDDIAKSVKQTNDGGYIVSGYSESDNGDVTGHHGFTYSSDYWIVKLNTSGNIVWQKSFGGSNDDEAGTIQQTTDGGFIVAGTSRSNDGNVSGNHGYEDYWILKLDTSGDILWKKSYGGSNPDRGGSVRQTIDGGFIVAGDSYSSDEDVSGNHGSADYWIMKLDTNGNIIWQKSFGGSGLDQASSIEQTEDGGFIVGGNSGSNDGDVSGNHGSYDYWILKLDSDGNLEWQKSLGGSGVELAGAVVPTSNGRFIVAGWTDSNDGDVSGNHGGRDYWVVKLDSVGGIIWQRSLGGDGWDDAFSVQQTTDSGFIVIGYADSHNGDVSENRGMNDWWIVKLDIDGNIKWQESLGGDGQDSGSSIQQTTDGGFITAGYSDSNNGDVSGNHGSRDYWVVKLSNDQTGIESPSNPLISLHPNPVRNLLTIDLATQAANAIIRVYDLQGRIIALPITFSTTQAQLNTTTLVDGFYTLQITNIKTGESEVGKFVKQQ